MASSATVGTAVIKLTFDGKDVTAQLAGISDKVEKSGTNSGKSFASAWSVAAGNLISKGVSKISSTISSNLGGAISRVDTLNNFPKVMTSLGYSAEESKKSIDDIGSALDGLPTSLDAMAGDVQKLAATMGNLDDGMVNATSVGLGLNDMFLAGGKGTAVASAAMEQYNQMLAVGKVDQQGWNSLVNAAPGQMNQLAQSILGVDANAQDLYEAMKNGEVSFDDLNAAIVNLDQEGGEGFDSFKNQAVAATDGIATQMENVGTSMKKVLAAALNGDDMAGPITQLFERVEGLIETLAPGVMNAIGAVVDMVLGQLPQLITNIVPQIVPMISNLIQNIAQNIPQYTQNIIDMILAIVNAIVPQIPSILKAVVDGILGFFLTASNPENLSAMLDMWVTLLLTVVDAIPDIIVALIDALPQIITNIITFLTSPSTIMKLTEGAVKLFFGLVEAVPKILGALLGAFGSLVGALWNGITSMFGEFAGNFGNFISGIFRGAINGVLGFIEGIINGPIDIINGFIGVINGAFGFLGVNLGTLGRISLPRLATGGIVTSETIAMIGEEGKEAVIPLENNTDNWAGLLAATLAEEMEIQGTDNNKVVIEEQNFIVKDGFDAREAGRLFMQEIRRAA